MGLSIGFSLCSGVEFVYWFTIRLWFNLIPGQTSSRSEAKSHRRAKSSQGQSQTQIPMSWTTDGWKWNWFGWIERDVTQQQQAIILSTCSSPTHRHGLIDSQPTDGDENGSFFPDFEWKLVSSYILNPKLNRCFGQNTTADCIPPNIQHMTSFSSKCDANLRQAWMANIIAEWSRIVYINYLFLQNAMQGREPLLRCSGWNWISSLTSVFVCRSALWQLCLRLTLIPLQG